MIQRQKPSVVLSRLKSYGETARGINNWLEAMPENLKAAAE
jgi:hypothetical protein